MNIKSGKLNEVAESFEVTGELIKAAEYYWKQGNHKKHRSIVLSLAAAYLFVEVFAKDKKDFPASEKYILEQLALVQKTSSDPAVLMEARRVTLMLKKEYAEAYKLEPANFRAAFLFILSKRNDFPHVNKWKENFPLLKNLFHSIFQLMRTLLESKAYNNNSKLITWIFGIVETKDPQVFLLFKSVCKILDIAPPTEDDWPEVKATKFLGSAHTFFMVRML